jgi:hypothetical protein
LFKQTPVIAVPRLTLLQCHHRSAGRLDRPREGEFEIWRVRRGDIVAYARR